MKKRIEKIIYTSKHRKAFRKVEKELLGYNTLDGLTHDLGKLLMLIFCPFLSLKTIKKIHKKTAKHHNAITDEDYIQKVIDYECARYTKPDKPYTAREYIEKTKNKHTKLEQEKIQKALQTLGL